MKKNDKDECTQFCLRRKYQGNRIKLIQQPFWSTNWVSTQNYHNDNELFSPENNKSRMEKMIRMSMIMKTNITISLWKTRKSSEPIPNRFY